MGIPKLVRHDESCTYTYHSDLNWYNTEHSGRLIGHEINSRSVTKGIGYNRKGEHNISGGKR